MTLAALVMLAACKKDNNKTSSANSWIVGFWTYKEDANVDYWNANVLFKNDGTFRMYQALTLDDTVAAHDWAVCVLLCDAASADICAAVFRL